MSPKNKGKFGKGKQDQLGPDTAPEDEFVSSMGRMGKVLEPYIKQVVLATAAIVACAILVVGYGWWDDRKEARATTLYQRALVLSRIPVFPPDQSGDENQSGESEQPVDRDGDGTPEEFRSTAQRAEATLAELDKLRSQYGSTATAAQASLLYAGMLYDLGRYSDAEAMFQTYAKNVSSVQMRRIAREHLGYAQEAMAMAEKDENAKKEGLKRALETFRQIQTDDEGPGRDRALYHEARILGALGDREKAIAALEKALEVAPSSDIRYEINLRRVQLQSKE
ncbi:MAG: hypothetical protein MJE77_16495 [Proteobacteria bacterium]|nr:hypothetical protein [Pseudomonadota bacterium]